MWDERPVPKSTDFLPSHCGGGSGEEAKGPGFLATQRPLSSLRATESEALVACVHAAAQALPSWLPVKPVHSQAAQAGLAVSTLCCVYILWSRVVKAS